jgi:hypothetical protein
MKWRRQLALTGVSILALLGGVGQSAFAQSSSLNYKVDESFFGSGGELDASSNNYRAKQSAGETAVGNASSAHYQFQGGFNTTDVPLLEFAVDGGTYDLGILDGSITGQAAANFSVRNYLSNGYIVTVRGSTPTTSAGSGHALPGLASPTGSSPGTEQFGVNLATNTNPPIGNEPVQIPDNTYSYGSATADYASPNLFKFVDGDTIAFSPKSSGQTNYSLSMMANVARTTPAGQYGGTINIQVVPTF